MYDTDFIKCSRAFLREREKERNSDNGRLLRQANPWRNNCSVTFVFVKSSDSRTPVPTVTILSGSYRFWER